ncbi:MAG TPA: cellulase family glycosylhydrolase [Myxococcota bacterium]|nr:cellulase family glycosylhydrolase [Myxococcota bacterium]
MMKYVPLLPILMFSILMACGPGDGKPGPAKLETLRVSVAGSRLQDALGREVILRGVNAGGRSKFAPFFPFHFRESGLPAQAEAAPFGEALDEYLERVESWGHNLLRLPFSWEALEPVRGTYDDVYLDRYGAVIDAAARRGLRVIVDFHQDVFASPYCGDGFPIWTLPQPVPDTPDDCSGWFLGYMNNENVRQAFDRFWSNQDGVRDAFGDMWRHVAGRLWPREGVIGFEVINEPGFGTADEEDWSKNVLTPFYAEMARVIREVAPGAPVFFDGSGSSAFTAETLLELPQEEGLIFAPHYYDPSVYIGGYSGASLSEPIGRLKALADEWGIPVILGEFGDKKTDSRAAEYVKLAFDAFDEYLMHATIWEYSCALEDWNNEGFGLVAADGTEESHASEVIRAYPAAVAGTITSFEYDAKKRSGVLVFDARAGGITEIAVPSRLYEKGCEAVVAGGESTWRHDRKAQRLVIAVTVSGPVTVTFGPM